MHSKTGSAVAFALAIAACSGSGNGLVVDAAAGSAVDAARGARVMCTSVLGSGRSVRKLTTNNAAALAGDPVTQQSEFPIEQLRRRVETKVTSQRPDLRFGDAYLLRWAPRVEHAQLVISVENLGATYQHMMTLSGKLVMRAADGTILVGPRGFLFSGASENHLGIYGLRGLGPGDLGYIWDFDTAPPDGKLFSIVTSVELTVEADKTEGVEATPGALFPIEYQVCSQAGFLEVTWENSSTPAMALTFDLPWALALDENGLPVEWTGMAYSETDTIAAGGRLTKTTSFANGYRHIGGLLVYATFAPAQAGSALRARGPAQDLAPGLREYGSAQRRVFEALEAARNQDSARR